MIVCLGWGSLVWDSRALPIQRQWFEDGPFARIDFLRKSKDKRVTLVLDESASPVRTLWAVLTSPSLQEAKLALAARECMTSKDPTKNIGSWSRGDESPPCIHELPQWAAANGIEQVVWTALGPKFNGEIVPTKEHVVEHLRSLLGPERDNAERYVRFAPAQIDTPYRRYIESTLGWVRASRRGVGA